MEANRMGVILLLCYMLSIHATTATPHIVQEPVQNVNKSRWMTEIRSSIGDKRLGHIVIPGSHDAGTFGITENFILVNKNPLFELAEEFTPQTLSNWSITQTDNLWKQLQDGYRYFDLRIADVEDEDDGNYRWWHGVTGTRIQEGLDHCARFARENPGEILLLNFGHFAKPGDETSNTLPIPDRRLEELGGILFSTLGSLMIPHGDIPENPTINQVLATGRNVIAYMSDSYIRELHPEFWPSSAHHQSFSGRSNPEDLFVHRTGALQSYKDSEYEDIIVRLSGCVTPNDIVIIGGLRNRYKDDPDPLWQDLFELLGIDDLDPRTMSFEGQWMDLVSLTVDGVNSRGMRGRPADLYTNGASVHYSGLNDWMTYWAARPDLFRLNVVYVDVTQTTTCVETAIQANRDQIPREVSIAFQGNTRDGYYEWDGYETTNGTDGFGCTTGVARYRIMDGGTTVTAWTRLVNKTVLTFQEGQHPQTATVELEVGGDTSTWSALYTGNIHNMITSNQDLYLRVAVTGGSSGFGYLDASYNLFGDSCDDFPTDADYVVQW